MDNWPIKPIIAYISLQEQDSVLNLTASDA